MMIMALIALIAISPTGRAMEPEDRQGAPGEVQEAARRDDDAPSEVRRAARLKWPH